MKYITKVNNLDLGKVSCKLSTSHPSNFTQYPVAKSEERILDVCDRGLGGRQRALSCDACEKKLHVPDWNRVVHHSLQSQSFQRLRDETVMLNRQAKP